MSDENIPKSKHMFLYMYSVIILCMLSYMCDFYLLFSAAWARAIRDTFIQVLVADTQYFVPQAILYFLPNIIQTYQYISCVYCITVHLYSFENHILVITQQFLVLYEGVQQQTQAAYQKSMLVVTATS